MTDAPDLFVTGAARSGTSLLDKLLSMHPATLVLSQPLPRLYVAAKRRFLDTITQSGSKQAFPLNDLFGANFRPPERFTAFLHATRFSPDWLAATLQAMTGFPGQYTPPPGPSDMPALETSETLAAFVARYLRAMAPPDTQILGSKETYAEEFVPYFLQSGTRVIFLVRDPRDVVASVFGAAGAIHAGQGLPLLFVLRQWRKSVAFALNHANDPGFRLVRYEDLVTGPDEQMAAIAAWMGCSAFPDDLSSRPLRDSQGAPWPSNSSHYPVPDISTTSMGRGPAILPAALIRAIETLCAPEMRVLGYDPGDPVAPARRAAVLGAAVEPCLAPRPELADHTWGEAALVPEHQRLAAFDTGHFEPRLHLFDRAFRQLAPAAPHASRYPVLGGRASALIHDLARAAGPGTFLLPANICPEVPLAVTKAGRHVRFVDIDPRTHAMQTDSALQILREATTDICGVIYAHTYGACFDVAPFFAAVKAIDAAVLIIEDRCACRPELDPPPAADAPDAVLYSTGYGKYADLGGGGYAFLAPGVGCQRHELPFDPDHAAAVTKALKTPAGTTPQTVAARWPNWLKTRVTFGSWPAFRAALAAERDRIDAQKARINAIYKAAIPPTAWLGPKFNDWRFCLHVRDKETLLARIFASGGFASGHYRPTGQMIGGPPAPVAEALYASVVNLFNDRHTEPAQATQVSEIVRRHVLDSTEAQNQADAS